MPTEKLTDARLRGLTHQDGEIIDSKSPASARADKTGTVTFTTRYRFGKKRPRIFLGTYPLMSLADARAEANQLHEQVRKGIDPQAERRSQTETSQLTFNEVADLYIERYAKRSKSSWQVDQRILRVDVRPFWGKRPAASITRQDAVKLLFDNAAHAPVGANRLKGILSKLFSWSVDNNLLTDNPMLGVKNPTKEGKGKTRALNDDELRTLWHAIERADLWPGTRAVFKVMMATGQRPGEVKGMVSGELRQLDDPQASYWELPPERMKARRGHILPLVGLAREIVLAELKRPRRFEFVFGGRFGVLGRNSLSHAMIRVIAGLDGDEAASLKKDPPTPHDLRRSAISGMARIGIARDDRMSIASHSHGDVHSVYDRHDRLAEKRAALERWDRHLRRVIAGEPLSGAEIVPLRQAAL